MSTGFVSIVGAGPGDPDLLTRRALRRLEAADVVFYDGLVPAAVLALAPAAIHQSVAKRAGDKSVSQDQINADLIATARLGCQVVRLKSGDPFVLGRGGEEALALSDAGVPFEIVPGVSSAIAAPALAGIPVTHRGLASSFVVTSGHDRDSYRPLLESVPPMSATVVVLMGLASRRDIATLLVSRGWDPDTPAAIIVSASQPQQFVWIGTLSRLIDAADSGSPSSPGVLVIGPVVALRFQENRHVYPGSSAGVRPLTTELRE